MVWDAGMLWPFWSFSLSVSQQQVKRREKGGLSLSMRGWVQREDGGSGDAAARAVLPQWT